MATLCVECSGNVLINHVPLLWHGEELHGHIARANELVEALSAAPQQSLRATAIFHGPQGYVSPSDYPTKRDTGKVVPTWNYAVIHVLGELTLKADADWIRAQVNTLTALQEGKHNDDAGSLWTLEDAPEAYAQAVLRGIVGVCLRIERVEGKFKLSQNRSDADQTGAIDGIRTRGNAELATLMDRRRPSP